MDARNDKANKHPQDDTNEEALLRFIRGSWYWVLAIYVAVVTIKIVVELPLMINWRDIYEITIMTIGFYGFYLAMRMQHEGRIPRLPSDVYD